MEVNNCFSTYQRSIAFQHAFLCSPLVLLNGRSMANTSARWSWVAWACLWDWVGVSVLPSLLLPSELSNACRLSNRPSRVEDVRWEWRFAFFLTEKKHEMPNTCGMVDIWKNPKKTNVQAWVDWLPYCTLSDWHASYFFIPLSNIHYLLCGACSYTASCF